MKKINSEFLTPEQIYNSVKIGTVVYDKNQWLEYEVIDKEYFINTTMGYFIGGWKQRINKITFLRRDGEKFVIYSHDIDNPIYGNFIGKDYITNKNWNKCLFLTKEYVDNENITNYKKYLDSELERNSISKKQYLDALSSVNV